MRITLLILAGLAFAAPAAADIDERPDNLEDCLREAQGITMEVDFCWSDEVERIGPRLEAAYEKAMSIAEEGQKAGLAQSQKDFLTYRESWCGAKGGFLGSGHNEYYARCLVRTTRERAEALENFDNP